MSTITRRLTVAAVTVALSAGTAFLAASPADAAPNDSAATASTRATTVTIHADRSTADRWQLVKLTGSTKPNLHGDRVSVQQKVGSGSWTAFNASSEVRRDGGYQVKVASGRKGTNKFRVVVDGHRSAAVTVKIS